MNTFFGSSGHGVGHSRPGKGVSADFAGGAGSPPRPCLDGKPEAPVASAEHRVPGHRGCAQPRPKEFRKASARQGEARAGLPEHVSDQRALPQGIARDMDILPPSLAKRGWGRFGCEVLTRIHLRGEQAQDKSPLPPLFHRGDRPKPHSSAWKESAVAETRSKS